MKILIATEKPFAPNALEAIKDEFHRAGHETVLLEKYSDRAQLLDAVKEVDGMIVRSDKITPEVFDATSNLKIIVRAGAGYDNIDTDYAKTKGIVVENTPGQNANAVAELVFGLLVSLARNFYNGKSGFELKGKRLGILAFGNVGRNVARIAKGFEMDVYAYDAYCSQDQIEAAGVHAVRTQKELFECCDIVSLHIPATKDTVGSIDYDLVHTMKKNAILINTARKEVIDEKGLLHVLAERPDIRYITDIKPDADAEFQKFGERYFATPKKMGAQTAEANTNAGIAAARQINAFFENGDVRFQVNK